MKIECDITYEELEYIVRQQKRAMLSGYKIMKVYKTQEGLCIQLNTVVLGQSCAKNRSDLQCNSIYHEGW